MNEWQNELNLDKDVNMAKAKKARENFERLREPLSIHVLIGCETDFIKYEAWLKAGFSKDQAFQLLLKTK